MPDLPLRHSQANSEIFPQPYDASSDARTRQRMDAEARKHGVGVRWRGHENTAAYLTLMLLALLLPILNTSQPSLRDSNSSCSSLSRRGFSPTTKESD